MSEARTLTRVAVLLVMAAALACGGERGEQAENAEPAADREPGGAMEPMQIGYGPAAVATGPAEGDTIVRGTVRAVGSEPFSRTVVQDAAGHSVGVTGELLGEIGRLVGAEVRVWGSAGANQPPPPERTVAARGYEILAVGGERPTVGELVAPDLVVGPDGDSVRLVGAPDDLMSRVGAKVWVAGPSADGAVRVQSYGVIREPPN